MFLSVSIIDFESEDFSSWFFFYYSSIFSTFIFFKGAKWVVFLFLFLSYNWWSWSDFLAIAYSILFLIFISSLLGRFIIKLLNGIAKRTALSTISSNLCFPIIFAFAIKIKSFLKSFFFRSNSSSSFFSILIKSLKCLYLYN